MFLKIIIFAYAVDDLLFQKLSEGTAPFKDGLIFNL